MPTATGGETIDERLTRLRAELTRVREVIARAESNGQTFNIGGTSVTQIAYERALAREKTLQADILALENRKTGSAVRPGMAVTVTRMG